jgi:hypothetical protein
VLTLAMGGKLFMAPLEKDKVKVRIGVEVVEKSSLTPSRKPSTLAQEQVSPCPPPSFFTVN